MRGRPGPGLIFAMWHHDDFSYAMNGFSPLFHVESTAVSSEAWAKLREWAVLAALGRLLLLGSVVLASLKAAVL